MNKRPNIIFISAEQQRGDTLHSNGASWMITPHQDALAADGVLFRQCFACAATCVSSRSAFYHALYPHTTGILGFYRSSGRLHWTHRLAAAGYHCVSIGKTHLPQGGFAERIAEQGNKYQSFQERGRSEWYWAVKGAGYEPPLYLHETDPNYYDNLAAIVWPLPEALHPDMYVCRRVLEWLDDWERRPYAAEQPFYLHIGLLSPHDLYDPPRRFLDLYADEDIPMPHVSEEERAGIPDELWEEQRRDEDRHGVTVVHASRATPERMRRMRKHYYALVTLIDEVLGRIIAALKGKGLYDEAIIIYTSDHGDHLWDHGLHYKGEMYDTITHVPLIIHAPDAFCPGRQVDDLVSHVDVAQYILEKAGVPGDDLAGISLAPVVEGEAAFPRRYAFAEEGATGLRPAPDLNAMIRSRTHKLIYFTGNRTGQLFDLLADPGETRNLWHNPEYRDLRAELTGELLDWLYSDIYKHRDLFIEAR
ncbi:MAG: sulfatase-like hydrolase/transferase [Chloroflexi bacterium]|nr:sulfatase-like hydrolase/transferase [Chloroflexota bacterium]